MKRIIPLIIMLLGSCAAIAGAAPKNGSDRKPFTYTVFQAGENGYHTYRIPAIIQTRSGILLAFAEARKNGRGDSGDIDLVVKRSFDGGYTWSEMITVWDDGKDNTCGNPTPVLIEETGRIVMLTTWNDGRDVSSQMHSNTGIDTRRAFSMYSDDEGLTWSEPKEITADVKLEDWTWYATGPCHAVRKQKAPNAGRLVMPCDHNCLAGGKDVSESHIVYSDDCGESWQLGKVLKVGNECSIAELPDGSMLLNMRSTRKPDEPRLRWMAVTEDGGETFAEPYQDPALQEPVCQGSMVNYTKKGNLTNTLLFSNPDSNKERRYMTLKRSDDGGKTWRAVMQISELCAAYSDLVVIERERTAGKSAGKKKAARPDVGLLYETGVKHAYERIDYVRIPASSLK